MDPPGRPAETVVEVGQAAAAPGQKLARARRHKAVMRLFGDLRERCLRDKAVRQLGEDASANDIRYRMRKLTWDYWGQLSTDLQGKYMTGDALLTDLPPDAEGPAVVDFLAAPTLVDRKNGWMQFLQDNKGDLRKELVPITAWRSRQARLRTLAKKHFDRLPRPRQWEYVLRARRQKRNSRQAKPTLHIQR